MTTSNNLKVENQNLSVENLQKIQWSETSTALCDFVTIYPLPQIVQIEEGYHGGSDENSLSMGQVLKIHTLTTERKLLCEDRHGKELHLPVHSQKVFLKPENYDTVYQRVQDLSHAKPLPKYVEVSRGYYDVDSDVNYELSIETGETLEVIEVNESNIFTKKSRTMTFRNSEGVIVKMPFDCVAGFKPLIDNSPRLLADIISSDANEYKYPFYFQFHGISSNKYGILKAKSCYDDHLIIASCGQGHSQVVFMIPQNLKVKVKVAVGTLQEDPEYEDIKRSYHNFNSLEFSLQKSKSFRGRMSSSASEIIGFPIVKKEVGHNQSEWVTFEPDDEPIEMYVPKIRAESDVLPSVQPAINGVSPERNKRSSLPLLTNGNVPEIKCTLQEDVYKEIRGMSVQEFAESLKSLNMEKRVDEFVANQVDGDLFLSLSSEELKDLNLTNFEIKKLSRFKEGWRPKID